MQQAQLVAGFQHEHLPLEESSKESRLIHPGHTSISSSYYWVGCWFCCFFSSFLFFRLLSRFGICWEGTRARGMELRDGGTPGTLLLAPGTAGQRTSARAHTQYHPRASVSLPSQRSWGQHRHCRGMKPFRWHCQHCQQCPQGSLQPQQGL